MILLKVSIDEETYQRLVERAADERRPIPDQAAVELRRAMGLPFPPPPAADEAAGAAVAGAAAER
jgi:hypothetical protein